LVPRRRAGLKCSESPTISEAGFEPRAARWGTTRSPRAAKRHRAIRSVNDPRTLSERRRRRTPLPGCEAPLERAGGSHWDTMRIGERIASTPGQSSIRRWRARGWTVGRGNRTLVVKPPPPRAAPSGQMSRPWSGSVGRGGGWIPPRGARSRHRRNRSKPSVWRTPRRRVSTAASSTSSAVSLVFAGASFSESSWHPRQGPGVLDRRECPGGKFGVRVLRAHALDVRVSSLS